MPSATVPVSASFWRCRGGHRHRECALDRPRAAVERELADDRVFVELFAFELPAAGQDADGDRQIERPGLFGNSAGARLMTTRSCGRTKPLLTIARSMRCVLSFTACSGRPTSMVFGSAPGETRPPPRPARRRCPAAKTCEFGEHRGSVTDAGRRCSDAAVELCAAP